MEKTTGKRVPMYDLKGYWEDRKAWKQSMREMDAENEKRREHERLAADADMDGLIWSMVRMSLKDKVEKVNEQRRTRKALVGKVLRQMADDHLHEKASKIVTVYKVRISRVPCALSWRSSLFSMSTFHTRISQRYVMQTDEICS